MRPNLIYTALLPVNGKWCPLNRMTTRSGKVFTITILARNLKENSFAKSRLTGCVPNGTDLRFLP